MRRNVKIMTGMAAFALMTSCTTVHNTAFTADVDTRIHNLTVADLTVSPQRVENTVSWSWNPFNQVSLDNEKKNASAGILRETNSDVLVEPQYEVHRRGLFRGGSLTVSGYPAKYSNFHTMTRTEAENLAIAEGRLTVNSTTAAPSIVNADDVVAGALSGVAVGNAVDAKKKSLPLPGSRHKKDFGRRQFASLVIGGVVRGGCEDGDNGAIGVMYGNHGSRWGYYVKGMIYWDGIDKDIADDYGIDASTTTGYITVGAIKTLPFGFSVMAGAGLGGAIGVGHVNYNGDDTFLRRFALPIDGAIMWSHRKINLMAGVTYIQPFREFEFGDSPLMVNVGVGITF